MPFDAKQNPFLWLIGPVGFAGCLLLWILPERLFPDQTIRWISGGVLLVGGLLPLYRLATGEEPQLWPHLTRKGVALFRVGLVLFGTAQLLPTSEAQTITTLVSLLFMFSPHFLKSARAPQKRALTSTTSHE